MESKIMGLSMHELNRLRVLSGKMDSNEELSPQEMLELLKLTKPWIDSLTEQVHEHSPRLKRVYAYGFATGVAFMIFALSMAHLLGSS